MTKQQRPSIGMVVPVLNEARELPALLHDLAGLDADELLFVDGGSADETTILLEESGLPWVRAGVGRATQMNAGASHLKSDVLLFLHADTRLASEHLADVRLCMIDDACVGGRFDVRLTGRHPLLALIAILMNLRSRLTGISTGDQAMFVRRQVFEQLGGFPDQPLMEDIELSRQLKRQGRVCCLFRQVMTSGRRWERHGVLRTIVLMWRLRLLYWLGVDAERLAMLYRQAR